MSDLFERWFAMARALIAQQPYLALALGAAMAAVFLSLARGGALDTEDPAGARSLAWTLYRGLLRLLWACTVVGLLAGGVAALQSALGQIERDFRHSHGRITSANLAAVHTIWGDEQAQGELAVDLGYEVEDTQRIESEDQTKPAIIRKTKKRVAINGNPFVSCRHTVTLTPNARKKGSAFYSGYETDCRFTYQLANPEDHEATAEIAFPLPSASAMYDGLVVKLDNKDVLPQIHIDNNKLVLKQPVTGKQAFTYEVAFRSRGMSSWYFQVRERREIRDFLLTLNLLNLAPRDLNNPEGCMTPTDTKPMADRAGTTVSYRLDHAIVNKGMGVALPRMQQPGEYECEILGEMQTGWVWLFAAVLLAFTRAGVRYPALAAILIGGAVVCGYGVVTNLYETPLGFWLAAPIVLLPLLGFLGWLIRRTLPGATGNVLAALVVYFGLAHPFMAGLDRERQSLYLNISAAVFLALMAWLIFRRKAGEINAATGRGAVR